ncbi:MAG: NAD-dependent epimerase/dehydratase family protein, partial [Synechococcaceae bacterium WBA_3_309]|nr:NAD-dependent epimerase/dehydratase family protein [Synechococcaceae bacterium WBA_3_309]
MSPERILITGASGCVGQHICHQLFQHSDAELLLWLRNPSKLTAVPHNHPRITLLVSDLRDQSSHDQLLKTVTRVIHTATAWGDPLRAKQVNVDAVKELLARLDPTKLNQVIYFSTASILNKDLQLFDEAEEFGTEY